MDRHTLKTYQVTIGLGYDDVTVEFDIPAEYTTDDKHIFDYIMGSIEVDWNEA